jgi:FKBP-type peptidyl-prolyl cis-trans isomerase 2
MITKGNTVDVHYTGKLTTGEVFDSSEGKEPLKFQVGSGQIIPGFEEGLMGKKVGDKITVNIQPENAYGQVREDLFVKVPLDKMPGEVQVGQSLQAVGDDNRPVQVIIKEVNEDHVVIDGNHPLAGKELVFDIEVVDVQFA